MVQRPLQASRSASKISKKLEPTNDRSKQDENLHKILTSVRTGQ